ncbi:MAG: CDP-alcohol phosphatidyltransferase family protein [bacterium TMED144]|nr:MAG: CDP-alcohol phosphatidyltransferase family protein [bacterium TMED144]|tara:strand:- start:106 stop:663 length:558 start_codon:yes stop_codon:yes gene_type:complete
MLINNTKIATLANLISLCRALMAIPIIYTLNYDGYEAITFLLIVTATLSDALDGWVARKSGAVTNFGKWIDPMADFVCIVSILGYLSLVDRFPGWFLLFYVIRHFFISVSAIYFLNNSDFILSSNWWGKWSAGITSFAIILYIWPWNVFPRLKELVLFSSTFLLIISWFIYTKTFYKEYKKINFK